MIFRPGEKINIGKLRWEIRLIVGNTVYLRRYVGKDPIYLVISYKDLEWAVNKFNNVRKINEINR